MCIHEYEEFEYIFLKALNIDVPIKKKIIRANRMPYMTQQLTKAIMRRSCLQNKFYQSKRLEDKSNFKKQRNYCNRLYKKEKRKYFNNLNLKHLTDNKTFWKTVKPFLSNKGDFHKTIKYFDRWRENYLGG